MTSSYAFLQWLDEAEADPPTSSKERVTCVTRVTPTKSMGYELHKVTQHVTACNRQAIENIEVTQVTPVTRTKQDIGTHDPNPLSYCKNAWLDDDGSFDERAAIAEYDGGLKREHAEALAGFEAAGRQTGMSSEAIARVIDLAAVRIARGAKFQLNQRPERKPSHV
jgi:hypothetical protein